MNDLRVAIDSLDDQERHPLALLGSLRFRMAPRFEALGLQLKWQVAETLGEQPHRGMGHMRARAQRLGSALRWHSGADGTRLELSIPSCTARGAHAAPAP